MGPAAPTPPGPERGGAGGPPRRNQPRPIIAAETNRPSLLCLSRQAIDNCVCNQFNIPPLESEWQGFWSKADSSSSSRRGDEVDFADKPGPPRYLGGYGARNDS